MAELRATVEVSDKVTKKQEKRLAKAERKLAKTRKGMGRLAGDFVTLSTEVGRLTAQVDVTLADMGADIKSLLARP